MQESVCFPTEKPGWPVCCQADLAGPACFLSMASKISCKLLHSGLNPGALKVLLCFLESSSVLRPFVLWTSVFFKARQNPPDSGDFCLFAVIYDPDMPSVAVLLCKALLETALNREQACERSFLSAPSSAFYPAPRSASALDPCRSKQPTAAE